MRSAGLALALAAALLVPPAVAGAGGGSSGCSAAPSPQGEWPSYGHDLSNTRRQPAASKLTLADAAQASDRWAASAAALGLSGTFDSVPVVADGCVFAGTSDGEIVAVDARTGKRVWKHAFSGGLVASGIFAPTVANDAVYVNVSGEKGPFAAALDEHTGDLLWQSRIIASQSGYYTNASAVIFGNLMVEGFSGGEGDPTQRGGFALIDTATGRILKIVHPVPDWAFKKGYAGPGIWSTAVVDPVTRYAYVGTGNPDSAREYRYTNSIVKVDLDRSRSTFGEIVDGYKGNVDGYYPDSSRLEESQACQTVGGNSGDIPLCGQLDLDFGASPTMYRDAHGRLVVSDLQKSGVLHAVFTDNMQGDWTTTAGAPCALCNAASPASDGRTVYAVGTPGGQMVAVNATTGEYRWVTPVVDGLHYEAVATAGHVVFTTDTRGGLDMFDSATGLELSRPLLVDARDPCTNLGGGVSIAEGSIFAACDTGAAGGSWLISLKLP